jgi:YVTN family beta-propeller protein
LYVALSNRDAVAAVDISKNRFRQLGLFNTRLPRQTYLGAIPESVVTSKDGTHLYVADAGSDAVAVFNTKSLAAGRKNPVEPMGFVPTEWIPMALATSGGKLYIATGQRYRDRTEQLPTRRS